MSPSSNQEGATLSIGALSKTTGIPVETLRTWERRYGFPHPDRSPGGHRIYDTAIVDELVLIKDALQQGYKPRQVMGLGEDVLRELLNKETGAKASMLHDFSTNTAPHTDSRLTHEFGGPAEQVEEWLEMGRNQDATGLDRSLQRCWFMCGSMMFLQHYIARLVVEVGEAWAAGTLTVGEEHFISERVRDFLTMQWRPMSARARGDRVLCANLPGEHHTLGLHMVATVLALHGRQLIFLGADVPIQEIVGMSKRGEASALCVSLSLAGDQLVQSEALHMLNATLSSHLDIVVGGGGAQRIAPYLPDQVMVMNTLLELEQWLVA